MKRGIYKTLVNYIRMPEGSKDFDALVKEAKEAIDILGRDNLYGVRLHTSTIIEKNVCPCTLKFYLRPVHEVTLIPVEVQIYGVTSGSDTPSTKALVEILEYAGFSIAHNARWEVFCNRKIKWRAE